MLCAKCKKPLDTTYVNAMGRKYHPDHFTCSACPTVFGPEGTYYEHEGEAFCLYHYTYLVAKKCAGCQQPIMKLFLQMSHRGMEEHWHPECYMIYKFWNVRISPNNAIYGNRTSRQLLKRQNAVSEQQIYQIWTVLSSFEESTATCISDMLLQVSGGHYLEALRQAERFVMHVDVLFAAIDDLEDELSNFDDSTGLQHTREPKLLCKKIVNFFYVLSNTQGNESNGLTQDLLSLVTSLAHYLKVLTRVALRGSLRAQAEYKCTSSIKALLSKLTETSDRQKWAMFRLSYQETDASSDLCASCEGAVETECIEHMRKRKRWHLYCFVCSSCNTEIQHVYPHSYYEPPNSQPTSLGKLYCPNCTKDRGLTAGGFKFVSQLEQYSFLMRVALKRLYGLLKMKNAEEYPDMAAVDPRYNKKLIVDGNTKSSATNARSHGSQETIANKEFDAALAKMDNLDLRGGHGSNNNQKQYQTKGGVISGDTLMPGAKEALRASRLVLPRDMSNSTSDTPIGSDLAVDAVAKAAVKEAKDEGSIVHIMEGTSEPSPPQVLADRRKPRVAHSTTIHAMKARMESRGEMDDPESPTATQQRRHHHGQIAGPQISVNALANAANSMSSSKPAKLHRHGDDKGATIGKSGAVNEKETVNRVKNMLSGPANMRFVSDLNTAELFCAKHVAVSRLTVLLGGNSEFSQADLVALIGASKKPSTSAAGMWSRLKTNLMKKDGSGSGGGSNTGGGNSGNGGKDRMRTATFGVPLDTLMERQGVDTDLGAQGKQQLHIPQFFELMLKTLSTMDMSVEGIFRKNGNIRRLREVADSVDKDFSRVDLKKDTPVQIAALLKKFLRELPDPLIPFRMRRLFMAISSIHSVQGRIEGFRHAIILMPQANRDVLNVLMTFLGWVATFSYIDEQTGSKMDTNNLATVIAPNIIYADVKEPMPRGDREDAFSYDACNIVQQFMEAGEGLWRLPEMVIEFLRDNSSEFAESVSELNTKDLLRRCECQLQQQTGGGSGTTDQLAE